ncbi:unnamed protein product [Dicrocoelium dendriticum]|nr:unnamed protein product [Dicrocoelium dendriticum]
MALFTPTNQKRLTNVSVVRLRKGGNRYELACYPNKVRAWRDKLETDLDEVLQIRCVFSNVSKGQFANKKEMFLVFRTEDETQIIKTILEQGELQLTEKERSVEQQSLFRDVAKMVSERCVNPETNRAYTATMIEKMMKDCHISLKANKSAKQHALEVIKLLRAAGNFKIAPAMMEAVISIDPNVADRVRDHVLKFCTDVIRQGCTENGNYDMAVVIEPENYGAIESLLHSQIRGMYSIEIMGTTKYEHKSSDVSQPAVNVPEQSLDEKPLPFTGDETAIASINSVTSKSNTKGAKPLQPNPPTVTAPVVKSNKTQRRHKRGKRRPRDDDWPDDDADES